MDKCEKGDGEDNEKDNPSSRAKIGPFLRKIDYKDVVEGRL